MTSRFGFFAALLAFAFSAAYGVAQVAQVVHVLAWPWDAILIFAPSLALAPAFVLTMASVHACARPEHKAASAGAFGLAVMYATLVSFIYFIQLGAVIPAELAGRTAEIAPFRCCDRPSVLVMADLLGYALMSLSTWIAAAAVPGGGIARAARLALIANGLLAPLLIAQAWFPWLIWWCAPWIVTFPLAMALLAAWFARPRSD